MPRILRTERRISPNPATLRTISGHGFDAPARAAASLGKQIASLGSSLSKEQDELDQFDMSKKLAEFSLQQRQAQFDADNSIQGDGRDHVTSSMQRYQQDAAKVMQSIPQSKRKRAELAILQMQTGFQGKAQQAEQRHQSSYFEAEAGKQITNVVLPNLSGNLDQFRQRLSMVDTMVANTPRISQTQRVRLQAQAAKAAAEKWAEGVHPTDGLEQLNVLKAEKVPEQKAIKGINMKRVVSQQALSDVAAVAKQRGYDPALALAIGHFESQGTFSTTSRPYSSKGGMVRNGRRVLSSAEGIFQFLDSNKKEFGYGKTAVDQTEAFIRKNNKETAYVEGKVGRQLKPWEKYLTHFQGPGGASKLLRADPNASVASVVGSKVVNSNPWMKGQTVGTFLGRVKREIESRMSAFGGGVPEATTTADYLKRELVLNADKYRAGFQKRLQKMSDVALVDNVIQNPGIVSPYDPEVKKKVNKAFDQKYGPEVNFTKDETARAEALNFVKSGIVPNRISARIQGDINSNDPDQMKAGFSMLHQIEQISPSGFDAMRGSSDMRKDLELYRHYSELFGEQRAVERIIQLRDPARKRVEKDIKKTADDFIKGLDDGDIVGIFNTWLPFDAPETAFAGLSKPSMMNEFKAVAREEFLRTNDKEAAEAYAKAHMKKNYGVTNITGTATIMRFPPEKFFSGRDLEMMKTKLADDVKEGLSVLKEQGLAPTGRVILESDMNTLRSVQGHKAGQTDVDPVVVQDGISMAKQVKKSPEWLVKVEAKNKDGVTDYYAIGYFSSKGLGQMKHAEAMKIIRENEKIAADRKRSGDDYMHPSNVLRRAFGLDSIDMGPNPLEGDFWSIENQKKQIDKSRQQRKKDGVF